MNDFSKIQKFSDETVSLKAKTKSVRELITEQEEAFYLYMDAISRLENEQYYLEQRCNQVRYAIDNITRDSRELAEVRKERVRKEKIAPWSAILWSMPVSLIGAVVGFFVLAFIFYERVNDDLSFLLAVAGAIVGFLAVFLIAYPTNKWNVVSDVVAKERNLEENVKNADLLPQYEESLREMSSLQDACMTTLNKLYGFNLIETKYRNCLFISWFVLEGGFKAYSDMGNAYAAFEEENRRNNYRMGYGQKYLPNLLSKRGLNEVKNRKREMMEEIDAIKNLWF